MPPLTTELSAMDVSDLPELVPSRPSPTSATEVATATAAAAAVPLPPSDDAPVAPKTTFTSTVPTSPQFLLPEVAVPLAGRIRLLLGDMGSLIAELALLHRQGMAPPEPVTSVQDAFAPGGILYYRSIIMEMSALLEHALDMVAHRATNDAISAALSSNKRGGRAAADKVIMTTAETNLRKATAHALRDLARAMLHKSMNAADLYRWLEYTELDDIFKTVPPCGALEETPGSFVMHATAMDVAAGVQQPYHEL